MLHDDAMFGSCERDDGDVTDIHHVDAALEATSATDDRRHGDRVPFPAELILLWNHDASLRHRYRILDASDGGYRIRTSLPLLEGTTGMVIRVLSGEMNSVAQPVMVAWCRRQHEGSGYEAGLRMF